MRADYASTVLAKGPVGYWRLGEAARPSAADSSGNGRDGTYRATPTFGQLGAIASDPNTALKCDSHPSSAADPGPLLPCATGGADRSKPSPRVAH
jgi:hypothetical protein